MLVFGEIFRQSAQEDAIVRGSGGEKRHAGPKLQVVGRTEDVVDGALFGPIDKVRTFPQPWPENRMREIGFRFRLAGDAVFVGHRALPQTSHLREDEPHPMRCLATRAEFVAHVTVERRLGIHEAVQIVWIIHRDALNSFP